MQKILLALIIILIFTIPISAGEVEENMVEFAYELGQQRAANTGGNAPTKFELREMFKWIRHYAHNRTVFTSADFCPYEVGYNPDQLVKDIFAIVWEESWFINEPDQDNGTGYGWIAMQWSTREDLIERVYGWKDYNKNPYKHREQAKMIVGMLLYLRHRTNNRHRTILGYNVGPGVGYINGQTYFNRFVTKRRVLDEILKPS